MFVCLFKAQFPFYFSGELFFHPYGLLTWASVEAWIGAKASVLPRFPRAAAAHLAGLTPRGSVPRSSGSAQAWNTLASEMPLAAAASAVFRRTNFLTAWSLGAHRAQSVPVDLPVDAAFSGTTVVPSLLRRLVSKYPRTQDFSKVPSPLTRAGSVGWASLIPPQGTGLDYRFKSLPGRR